MTTNEGKIVSFLGGLGLVVAAVSCSCSGGCSNLRSVLRGDPTPDDSAEAMVGEYPLEAVRSSTEGCLSSQDASKASARTRETNRQASRYLRVERIDADERSGPSFEPEEGKTDVLLRAELCSGSESCTEPSWATTLEKSGDFGWRGIDGTAIDIRDDGAARPCRLEVQEVQLKPTSRGMHLQRVRRVEVVPMEGDEKCDAETAVGYGKRLECGAETRFESPGGGEGEG